MNGAKASTVVATMSSNPVTHRKMANGTSQRRFESLRHNPRASSAIDPKVLPNTISPRWILPRFLSTQLLPPLRRSAFRYSGLAHDQDINTAAKKGRISLDRAI